jgi:broad specificity phosphatase PhoE
VVLRRALGPQPRSETVLLALTQVATQCYWLAGTLGRIAIVAGVSQADGSRTVNAPFARVFADHVHARDAIRALEAAGVNAASISIVARSEAEAETLERDTGASEDLEDATQHRHPLSNFVGWLGRVESATVPGFGAILGSGDLWQDISMAANGRGAITGALVGLGLPVDTAADLERAVFHGQILVVVHGAFNRAAVQSVLGAA